jgi:hypothetical protein
MSLRMTTVCVFSAVENNLSLSFCRSNRLILVSFFSNLSMDDVYITDMHFILYRIV